MLQLLKNLRFHSHGKEIVDADILQWANSKVRNSASQSRMESFKVQFRSHIRLTVVEHNFGHRSLIENCMYHTHAEPNQTKGLPLG